MLVNSLLKWEGTGSLSLFQGKTLLGQFLGTSQGTIWWFHPGHFTKLSDDDFSMQYLERVFMLPFPQVFEHFDHALHIKFESKQM